MAEGWQPVWKWRCEKRETESAERRGEKMQKERKKKKKREGWESEVLPGGVGAAPRGSAAPVISPDTIQPRLACCRVRGQQL